MFSGTLTVVTAPELRRSNSDGSEFLVARACKSVMKYDRRLGAEYEERTYLGLIALEPEHQRVLAEVQPKEQVRVMGDLRREEFTRKDGRDGTDMKLVITGIEIVREDATAAVAAGVDFSTLARPAVAGAAEVAK